MGDRTVPDVPTMPRSLLPATLNAAAPLSLDELSSAADTLGVCKFAVNTMPYNV